MESAKMNVFVCQEKKILPDSISLKEVLHDIKALHCAVLVNSQFVPHSLHSSTYLKEGDQIELITPMQGG
jgi:thiamine biosynthesis protein ThiS